MSHRRQRNQQRTSKRNRREIRLRTEQLESRQMLTACATSFALGATASDVNSSFRPIESDDTVNFACRATDQASIERIERFDLAAQEWLDPITTPTGTAAAHVDTDGIYAAVGTSIYQYDLDGSNERLLVDVATLLSPQTVDDLLYVVNYRDLTVERNLGVGQIYTDGDLLFANMWWMADAGNYQHEQTALTTIRKSDPTEIVSTDLTMGRIVDFDADANRILGKNEVAAINGDIVNAGLGSPTAKIYDADGRLSWSPKFGNSDWGPHVPYGSLPSAAWSVGSMIVTSEQDVLDGDSLAKIGELTAGSLPSHYEYIDAAASVDDVPISLDNNVITSYFDQDFLSTRFVTRGFHELSEFDAAGVTGQHLAVDGDHVFAFGSDANAARGLAVAIVPLTELGMGAAVERTIWTLENRQYRDRNLSVTDLNDVRLDPVNDATSEWIVTNDAVGIVLQNRATGLYLGAANYEATASAQLDRAQHWTVVANADGSISLQNVRTRMYLDGDGPGENWDVDSSRAILDDDGWFVTAKTETISTETETAIWTFRNRFFDDRFLHDADAGVSNPSAGEGNAKLETADVANDEWIVTSTSKGMTIQNRTTKRYLAAGGWSAFTQQVLEREAYWRVIENTDGSVSLQNLATGRYLDGDGEALGWDVDESLSILADDGWFVTKSPYEPTEGESRGTWVLNNRQFSDRVLHATGSNADLSVATAIPDSSQASQWEVTTGDATTLRNVATGEYLAAVNWEAYTTSDAGSDAQWNLIENADGSISLQNIASGRYLDGDGPVDNWNVDESTHILSDDGWFVTDVTKTGDGVVTGFVFSDADANGERRAELIYELGLPGKTVWIDVNSNGTQDSGEPFAITNEAGEYRIDNAPLGTHTVRYNIDSGWTGTTADSAAVSISETESVVEFGQNSAAEPYVGLNGEFKFENRQTEQYLYAEYSYVYTEMPDGGHICMDQPIPSLATYPKLTVDENDLPNSVQLCGAAGTEWTLTTSEKGTLISNVALLAEIRDVGHLVSRAPWSVRMDQVPRFSETEPSPEDYWGVVLNGDGSISFQNKVTGQYLDTDSDGSIGMSSALLNDDGWFIFSTATPV